MSTRQLKQLLQSLNRDKALCAQRKLQEDAPPTVYYQKTLTTQMREQSSETYVIIILLIIIFINIYFYVINFNISIFLLFNI